jgi:hypothetical protein
MVACDTDSSEEKLYVYQGDVIKRYGLESGQSDWSVPIENPVELDPWDSDAGLELIDQGGTLVATLDKGKRLDFWDIESKQKVPPGSRPNLSRGGIRQRRDLQTEAISGDESVTAIVENRPWSCKVIMQRKGNQDFQFEMAPGSSQIHLSALSYDGKRLAVGRLYPVKFAEPSICIEIYDTQSGDLLGILKCDYGYPISYHFTRDGDRLLGLRRNTPGLRELDHNRVQTCIDVWDLKEMRTWRKTLRKASGTDREQRMICALFSRRTISGFTPQPLAKQSTNGKRKQASYQEHFMRIS